MTRSRFSRAGHLVVAATIALGLIAGVAACSSGASGSTAHAASHTVKTANGEISVPVHPQRVVSVHSWTTESLYDLGLTPVAVEDSGEQYVPSRYLDRWKKAPKISNGADLNLEQIAALKPDLIVGVDVPYLAKLYPKLKAIAPTAFAPFGTGWSEYATATAKFVNEPAALNTLKAGYDEKIASIKKEYAPELAKYSWDVIQGGFDDGNYWIYGDGSPVGSILKSLGATFGSASTAVKGDDNNSVSYEQTDLLADADFLIYYTNNDGTPANNIDKLFALQSFKQLKAATADRVVPTTDFLPGSYSDGIGVLDVIEKALAAAKG
ncbi:ABC transporter substrate-binding protein [Leifsonia poae]|uniref:ABC transporter substrate-binding protein n=1 Tax=Leifsonia poae TaxID=110933 RepID=UPI001CC13A23|nr:ABC transporter substrate-binding protein [Leifsonia poae]